MQEREYALGFSVFPGIGPKRFDELCQHFGSAAKAWHASEDQLCQVIGKAFAYKFVRFRETFSPATYQEKLTKKNVWYVVKGEAAYPNLLTQVEDSPIVLFGRGESKILSSTSTDRYIGIVGTRKITGYGKQVTELITEELVSAGCSIVSGLALGVDAVAHRITIVTGGKTIAVLGSGVDICHPASNTQIYNSIITSGGAVISEYPLGEPPSIGSFPARNRIIAGLSEGIVVTEGTADSGALITAEYAFSFGRNVYAVPGPITSSLSKGPNSLLASGAKLVTSGRDILEDLSINSTKSFTSIRSIKGETEDEQQIIDILHNESLLFDEIVKKVQIDAVSLGALLSMMELKGMIEQSEGIYRLRT